MPTGVVKEDGNMPLEEQGESSPLARHPTRNLPDYGATDGRLHTSDDQENVSFLHIMIPCLAMWSVTFIGSVDTTIVAMLLGNISSSFLAAERASWIGSTFLLSVCCTAPLYGRLSDLFGRKRSLLLAVSIFTLGTLWCATARTMDEFLVARALAGLGGGGLNTLTSVIMSGLVPLKSRGVFQGLANIVYGLGVGTGAPLGGVLNDTIGWRGAFYIQIPVLLLALMALTFCLEHDEAVHFGPGDSVWKRIKDVDMLGLLLFSFVPLTMLCALDMISVRNLPLTNPYVLTLLGVSSVALALFLFVERRVARFPLLSLDILSLRTARSTLVGNFFLSVALFSYNYYLPLFFQTVARMTASDVGVRMMPSSFAIGVGSLVSGFYMRYHGRYCRYLVACSVVVFMTCLPSVLYLVDPPTVTPFVLNVFWSFAQAGYLTCALVALIHVVDKRSLGVATGMSYLFRTTGQVTGVAFSGCILQLTLARELSGRILGPGSAELIEQIRHDSTILPSLPEDLRYEALWSYTYALHNVFIFVNICYFITMITTMFVEDKHLDEVFPSQERDDE